MTRAASRTAGLAALVLLLAGAAAGRECERDAGCKLIFSSCLCEAVPAGDPRRSLPSEVDCAVNRCGVEKTRAVCDDGECVERPSLSPR